MIIRDITRLIVLLTLFVPGNAQIEGLPGIFKCKIGCTETDKNFKRNSKKGILVEFKEEFEKGILIEFKEEFKEEFKKDFQKEFAQNEYASQGITRNFRRIKQKQLNKNQ